MKHILRKILTIITIFIATYILFSLYKERQSLLKIKEKENFALLSTENSRERGWHHPVVRGSVHAR